MFKKGWTQLATAALAAFCVYTCMHAFRKPFTAAAFANLSFIGIDYKVWLVIAQTIGYTAGKFYRIRFIAELKSTRRSFVIIGFIVAAWIALFFFAITPPPYNILFLLINGFPLGVIYGLVFRYLEGRRSTELLGAVWHPQSGVTVINGLGGAGMTLSFGLCEKVANGSYKKELSSLRESGQNG